MPRVSHLERLDRWTERRRRVNNNLVGKPRGPLEDFAWMLSPTQLMEMQQVGWTRLPGVLGAEAVAVMAERIWGYFAERGVTRDDSASWPVGFSAKNQGLRQAGVFEAFANPITEAALDQLLGEDSWSGSEAWGPALVTWPEPGPWRLPYQGWHYDLPAVGNPDRPAAARLLGYIGHVEERCGGTLVVEGSHELVRRLLLERRDALIPSRELRKTLNRRHPWFAALSGPGTDRVQRFMIEGDEIDGVRVRVRELTGRPGDVVAMMPWTLHAMSMNTGRQPRLMVTHTVMRHDQTFYPST